MSGNNRTNATRRLRPKRLFHCLVKDQDQDGGVEDRLHKLEGRSLEVAPVDCVRTMNDSRKIRRAQFKRALRDAC